MEMNTDTDFKAKKLWEELSAEQRIELLRNFQFWDGFSTYLYEYLPETLQEALRGEIESN
jgi:hypothetical protein